MGRKARIILLVFIILFVIVSGFGGYLLWRSWPAEWSRDQPVLDFPVENPDVIWILGGFGMTDWGFFHPGIDFGCNTSVNILAPCNLRVVGISTWLYATEPDRWQTTVQFNINWIYTLEIAFESWALNETYANLQREAVTIKVNQFVSRGAVLGQLLYHGEGTHIHFMIKHKGEAVCPYYYFSDSAKTLFDSLWIKYGVSASICNDTSV